MWPDDIICLPDEHVAGLQPSSQWAMLSPTVVPVLGPSGSFVAVSAPNTATSSLFLSLEEIFVNHFGAFLSVNPRYGLTDLESTASPFLTVK